MLAHPDAVSRPAMHCGYDGLRILALRYRWQAIFGSAHRQDYAEGIRAFVEKRKPVFKGR